ncbi:matrixin family metalloprotease [Gluconobacter japonicus]|uniref:matrixin family metalloprotease n=1 Tax=Gluconobacter japonicus TaxID=376620 RepID=UPI0024ACC65F|nr:matrixin family metalloprotease [Gluconobacter japonicus]MDI6654096.1 matrixin family metalloprotease [Gluconobacter japonicus]
MSTVKVIALGDAFSQLDYTDTINGVNSTGGVIAATADLVNPIATITVGTALIPAQIAKLTLDVENDAKATTIADDAIGLGSEATAVLGASLTFIPTPFTDLVGEGLEIAGNLATLAGVFLHGTSSAIATEDTAVNDTIAEYNSENGTDTASINNSFVIPTVDASGTIDGLHLATPTSEESSGDTTTYNFSGGTTVKVSGATPLTSNIGVDQEITEEGADGTQHNFSITDGGSDLSYTQNNGDVSEIKGTLNSDGSQSFSEETISSSGDDLSNLSEYVTDLPTSQNLSGSYGDFVTTGVSVNISDYSSGEIFGSNNSVEIGQSANTTFDGDHETVTSGNNGEINLDDSSNDIFNPGSDVTIDVGGGSNNDTFDMVGTGDTVDIWGSDETFSGSVWGASESSFTFEDNDSGNTLNGNDDTITDGSNVSTTFEGTGDTVTTGNDGTITLDGASNDIFDPGSNVTIDIGGGSNNDTFDMVGTGDTVDIWGSDETFSGSVWGASESSFTFEDNDSGNTLNGNDDTITDGSNVSTTFEGTGDTVTTGNDGTITLDGASNDIFDPGSNVTIDIGGGSNNDTFGMVGTGDTVNIWGSDETFSGSVWGASESSFTFEDNDSGNTLNGNDDSITSGSNTSTTIVGDGDSIELDGSGSWLGVSSATITTDSNDNNSTIDGDNDIYDSNGSEDIIGFDGLNDTANISNGTVNSDGNDQSVTIYGNTDSYNSAWTGDIIYDYTVLGDIELNNGAIHLEDDKSNITISGDDLSVTLSEGANVTVTGDNDTFTGGEGDIVTIDGEDDTVDTDNGSITFSGSDDDGDEVTGTGDDEVGGGYNSDDSDDDTSGGGGGGGGETDNKDYDDEVAYGLVSSATHYSNIFSDTDVAGAGVAWQTTENAITNATLGISPDLTPLENKNVIGSSGEITWSFSQSNTDDTARYAGSIQSEYQGAIEDAIKEWSQATGITFDEVSSSSKSDLEIAWGNLDTASSGVAGATFYEMPNGNESGKNLIELENPLQDSLGVDSNGNYSYTGSGLSLTQLALHEVGHALGLSESSNQNSIMFPELSAKNESLDKTDVEEVKALYGLSGETSVTSLLQQAATSFTDDLTSATTSSISHVDTFDNPLLTAHAA